MTFLRFIIRMSTKAVIFSAVFILSSILHAATAVSQEVSPSLDEKNLSEVGEATLLDMSLEDLLDVEVDVVSKSSGQKQSLRDVPGIVTVIDREQLMRMGARDLLEVLRQVQGFQIGGDSSNSYYAGIRGLWALDGKLLVLVDGHEMNELMYSSVNLGNRFPLDWIERIEIIRGPGSVMYGGSAAYGVINIVTRSAEELNGVSSAISYSQMLEGVTKHGQSLSDTFGQRYVSANAGRVFNPEKHLGLTLDLFASQGMMSDRPYTDINGDTFNMAGNSETGSIWGKAKFTYRGLTASYLIERYRTTTRDGWGENLDQSFPAYFTTSSLKIGYQVNITDKVSLTPELRWLFEKPWEITDEESRQDYLYWEPVVHRVSPSLTLRYTPKDWIYLSAAAEYQFDYVKDDTYGFLPDPCVPDYYTQAPDTSCMTSDMFHTFALYGEAILRTKPVDISAGVRYEYNSATGNAAVPRAAFTKSFERVHVKLLGSQAFRSPSINNLAYNDDLKRDRTTAAEAEIGLKLPGSVFFTVNGFLIHVKDPIVYYYDIANETESFINYKQIGTAGFETELSFKWKRHFMKVGYSYYHPVFSDVEIYKVPGHDNVLLAFAKHKASLSAGLTLIDNLTLNVAWSLLFGDRYGYVSVDEEGNSTLQQFDPEFIADVNLRYTDFLVDGLSIMVGGRNVTNSEINYIQPYDGGHPPNPGPSAEVFLKIGYDFVAK
jgi:outer membrane cobalamin receptor